MNFRELTLSNILFSYKGGIIRRQYALGILVNYLILFGGIFASRYFVHDYKKIVVVFMVCVAILVTYSFTVLILKRLRNIGLKWWWIILAFFPYVGLIFVFALMFIKPKDADEEKKKQERIRKEIEEIASKEFEEEKKYVNSYKNEERV